MAKAKRVRPLVDWMEECFGLQDEDAMARCRCPPACKELCRTTKLTPDGSPRASRDATHFTPIMNALTRDWGDEKVGDPARLTYLCLVSWTLPTCRWIWKPTAEIARSRGISIKSYLEHLKQLEEAGLIKSIPLREVVRTRKTNDKTIVILDLPKRLIAAASLASGIETDEPDVEIEADLVADDPPFDFGDEDAEDPEAERDALVTALSEGRARTSGRSGVVERRPPRRKVKATTL